MTPKYRKDFARLENFQHKHSVLIVDDEESIRNSFQRIFADEAYEVHTASTGWEGLNKLHTAQKPYSLIISDQRMPLTNGVQFFSKAKDIFPDAVHVLLTGYDNSAAMVDAVHKGEVHLYLRKPWQEKELLLHIKQSFSKAEIIAENKRLLESIKTKDQEIQALNKKLINKNNESADDLLAQTEKLKENYKTSQIILDGIVKTLSKMIATRDPYTSGHEDQVAKLARRIAEERQLSEDQISAIHVAAALHDIGKISIPSEILTKPGILSDLEKEIIKTHCKVAKDLISDIEFPYPVAEIIYQHHERMDGSGYPCGLTGNEVSIEARIIAVADVVDAMASYRPYRPALGMNAAIDEIVKFRDIKYDPQVVDACLKLYKRTEQDKLN